MRTLAALIFSGFQTLDLYGPPEMLGDHDVGEINIMIVAGTKHLVVSSRMIAETLGALRFSRQDRF